MPTKRPFIWGHRGASGYEPENTMRSFRKALELGADGVETDAFCTADDQVILSHDGVLNRNGGKVPIRALSLAEMKEDPEGQLIPTFAELLAEFQPRKVPISVDVRDLKTIRELIKILDARHALDVVEVCVDVERYVKKMRELSNDVIIIFSPSVAWPLQGVIDLLRKNLMFFEENRVKAVNFSWRFYITHPTLLSIVHQEGHLLAYAWDVHQKNVIQKVVPLGLDALYTNYPDRVRNSFDALDH